LGALFYADFNDSLSVMHNFYILCISITSMEYLYASTIEEACRLIADGFVPIAGGTEINIKHRAEKLVDISGLGLGYITRRGDKTAVGASATIAQIEASDILDCYSALKVAAMNFTRSVKHLATVGGNIAESVASADTAPPLLVFDAEAVLCAPDGERTVPVESLFSGLRKSSLRRDEMIKEFLLPPFCGRSFFRKIGRTEDDLALTSIAVCTDEKGRTRIAFGSAADVPMRARKTEMALDSGVEAACSSLLSETRPRNSIRASADYRKRLEAELLREALSACGVGQ
jgi:carbon-monoxide dehydrogenase medium subunit